MFNDYDYKQTSKKSEQTPIALWSTVTANHLSSSGITVRTYLCSILYFTCQWFTILKYSRHRTPYRPPGPRWGRSRRRDTPPGPPWCPPGPWSPPPAAWWRGKSHRSTPSIWYIFIIEKDSFAFFKCFTRSEVALHCIVYYTIPFIFCWTESQIFWADILC